MPWRSRLPLPKLLEFLLASSACVCTELSCCAFAWVAFGQCAAVPLARIAPLHHCRRRGTTSNRSESYKTKRRVRERDKDRRESEKEARTDTIFANNRTRGFPHAVYSTIGCGPFTRMQWNGRYFTKVVPLFRRRCARRDGYG